MRKHTKKVIWLGCSLLAVFLLSIFLSYRTMLRDPVTLFFKKIYPAVFVGLNYISINDWEEERMLAQKLDSQALPRSVFDHMVFIKKEQELLKKLKVTFESDTVPDELTFSIKGKKTEYENILKTYFSDNPYLFEKYVVLPEAVDSQLRIKYNSDVNLNSQEYNKIQEILSRIKSGEQFETLAKAESDDKISGQLGGDLGFFEHGQILPELEKEITIRPLGQVYDKIIISRLGYHIIYPVETAIQDGKKLWHVKHILIETEGFDNWLNNQIKDYKVWRLIQI